MIPSSSVKNPSNPLPQGKARYGSIDEDSWCGAFFILFSAGLTACGIVTEFLHPAASVPIFSALFVLVFACFSSSFLVFLSWPFFLRSHQVGFVFRVMVFFIIWSLLSFHKYGLEIWIRKPDLENFCCFQSVNWPFSRFKKPWTPKKATCKKTSGNGRDGVLRGQGDPWRASFNFWPDLWLKRIRSGWSVLVWMNISPLALGLVHGGSSRRRGLWRGGQRLFRSLCFDSILQGSWWRTGFRLQSRIHWNWNGRNTIGFWADGIGGFQVCRSWI